MCLSTSHVAQISIFLGSRVWFSLGYQTGKAHQQITSPYLHKAHTQNDEGDFDSHINCRAIVRIPQHNPLIVKLPKNWKILVRVGLGLEIVTYTFF